MSDQSSPASAPSRTAPANRRQVQVTAAVALGLVLAVVGLAIGLTMALKRREAQCPDGTYFPEGTTDFRCFVHPSGLEGSAIAVISVMLGLLIVLVGFLIKSSLDDEAKAQVRAADGQTPPVRGR